MPISEAGLALLRKHEGLRLKAYPDPASGGDPWTIGYGHTRGVKRGDQITLEQAEAFLREDAAEAENAVLRLVERPLTQGQHDALISFVFNVGEGNFAKSTLLKLINAGEMSRAADEFSKWTLAAGKRMPGLVKRRSEERHMFLSDLPLPAVETIESDWPFPQRNKEVPMAPFVAAALPALLQAAPALIRIFGESPQAEKNAQAAELVASIATTTTNAATVQEAVEVIQKSPEQAAAFRQQVQAHWFELQEIGGGVEAARKANKDQPPPARNLALWVTGLLLPLVYMTVAAVLFGDGWSTDVKAMVVAAVVTGALGGITAYWLGTSAGSAKKTDLLAGK